MHLVLLVTLWRISITISPVLEGWSGLLGNITTTRIVALLIVATLIGARLIVTLIRHGDYICREIVTENEVSGGVGWVCGADPDEAEAAVDE